MAELSADLPEVEDTEDQPIDPVEFVRFVTESENLAAELDESELTRIGREVYDNYKLDKESMSEWFRLMERGLDLARLAKGEAKTYPFPNASNVKYPLITSAAFQFSARAYPAIVPEDRPVKARVWGADPQGEKAARAERISEHMSWQLLARIKEWERETDKLLVQLPIVGEMFRKWWYDPVEKRPRCRLIEPGKFIVNDAVKDLESAPRCTEEFELYPHEVETRIRAGRFIEFDLDTTGEDDQAVQDFIEHHCRLDLDEDGYAEPYIVTMYVETQKVVAIVADFEEGDVAFETEKQMVPVEQVVQDPISGQAFPVTQMAQQEVPVGIQAINRHTYFQEFQFLPGIGGGFHGTGLGLLLGDISDSINTIMNMLLDAGHYASLGGGFIGSDFRMKGASQRFRPGEWKMANATGSDIKNSIVPMTFPGPDATLYQMLGMLIDAGREIASVQDVITGEGPRQQQTATTTLALIEQGMMVFTAAYKRIFRACKGEYGLLAAINQRTVTPEEYQNFHDEPGDPQQDYNAADLDIQPVADPRSVTKMQKAAKAQMVFEWSQAGMVDPGEALTRMSEAMDIEDVEDLLPKPNPAAQEMEQMQMAAMRADLSGKMVDIELTLAKVKDTEASAIQRLANAETDAERVAIEQDKTRIEEMKVLLDDERGRIESLLRGVAGLERTSGNGNASGGNAASTGGPQAIALGQMVSGQAGF